MKPLHVQGNLLPGSKEKNFQASHHDMNTWHVKTAKSRDTKLVRLPQPPFLKENNT